MSHPHSALADRLRELALAQVTTHALVLMDPDGVVGADRIEFGRFLASADRRLLLRILEKYVEQGLQVTVTDDILEAVAKE